MKAVLRAIYQSPAKAGAVALIAILLAFPKQLSPSDWNGAEEIMAGLYTMHGTIVLVSVWVAHIVLGLVLGGAADLILRFHDAAASRERTWKKRYAIILVSVLVFQLWRIAACIAKWPQLYAPWFYMKGGFLRGVQTTLTHGLPPGALEWGWLLVGLAVVAPLRRAKGRELVLEGVRGAFRGRKGAVFSAALVALGAVVVVRSLPVPLTDDKRPNILIIGVDSLRADRVTPRVAPRMAGLAAQGVNFERAYVSLPRTFTAWTTLLTGRTPEHHGIRHMFPRRALREGLGPTLPRALRALGYSATVETQNGPTPLWAFDFGFENVTRLRATDVRFEITGALTQRHAALLPVSSTHLAHRIFPPLAQDWSCCEPDRLADQVCAFLTRDARRKPFFHVAFFNAPHMPYSAPSPWYRKFTKDDYVGPYKYECYAYQNGAESWSDADMAQSHALYDGSIASTDEAIGRILDALADAGLRDNTIVVLLGDHGENLGEMGRGYGHGEHLRGEKATRVPFVIVDPVHRFKARSVSGIVRDLDVAPTLAALVSTTVAQVDGVDLGPLLRGEKDDLGLDAFHETELPFGPEEKAAIEAVPFPKFPRYLVLDGDDASVDPKLEDLIAFAKQRAVRSGKWKLTYKPTTKGAQWKLFDLERDPEEEQDVSATETAAFELLKGKLVASLSGTGWTLTDGFLVPKGDFQIPR